MSFPNAPFVFNALGSGGGGGGTVLASKSGAVAPGSFAGTPLKYTVVFAAPFVDDQYSVNITGDDARTFTYESKTAAGFVINTNANTALTGDVLFYAAIYGEST